MTQRKSNFGRPHDLFAAASRDPAKFGKKCGVNPVLNDPDAIFPYSIGKYIAEKFHSTTCINSACTPDANGNVCNPVAGKNLFGCNTHGTMVLKRSAASPRPRTART